MIISMILLYEDAGWRILEFENDLQEGIYINTRTNMNKKNKRMKRNIKKVIEQE